MPLKHIKTTHIIPKIIVVHLTFAHRIWMRKKTINLNSCKRPFFKYDNKIHYVWNVCFANGTRTKTVFVYGDWSQWHARILFLAQSVRNRRYAIVEQPHRTLNTYTPSWRLHNRINVVCLLRTNRTKTKIMYLAFRCTVIPLPLYD